ncbi:MAG: glycosyltransferase family 2 protein [Desulfobulbaceae bacterium]
MSDQETISVIIPNYNNGLYIDKCLDSVAGQSYGNLEIIIIDDCSTDSSPDIIRLYAARDKRFVPIFNADNIGVARNRHKGLMMCRGAYVSTLDSDDVYCRPDKLEKEYARMREKQQEGLDNCIVFSGIVLIDRNGKVLGRQHDVIREGAIMNDIVRRTCMVPRDFLFTREQYLAAGGFDTRIRIYEDWDLKIRLAKRNRFYYSGIDGIGYRRHGAGLSAASPLCHAGWLLRIFAKNYSLLETERVKTTAMLGRLVSKMIRNHMQNRLFRKAS